MVHFFTGLLLILIGYLIKISIEFELCHFLSCLVV